MAEKPIYIYITPFFPSPQKHHGSYSYDFVKALMETGEYDVRVFVPGCGSGYEFNGVRVYSFNEWNLPSSILPLLFKRRNGKSFLRALAKFGIDVANIVVCHANTAAYAVYALALKKENKKCKALLHHHDLASCGLMLGRLRNVWLHKVINWIGYKKLFRAIDLHIFISEAVKRSFLSFPDTSWAKYDDYLKLGRGLKWLGSVTIKDSVVLHNGVPEAFFAARHNRPAHEGFVVGCCANYRKMKDVPNLVRALAMVRKEIPELRIRFLGIPGNCKSDDELRLLVEELGLSDILKFEPALPHERLPEFYRELDLFVLPSYFEGFGCVYVEAYACGTPFIACEGQGIEDVVPFDERKTWLCEPQNPMLLSKMILAFYRSRNKQNLIFDCRVSVIINKLLGKIAHIK